MLWPTTCQACSCPYLPHTSHLKSKCSVSENLAGQRNELFGCQKAGDCRDSHRKIETGFYKCPTNLTWSTNATPKLPKAFHKNETKVSHNAIVQHYLRACGNKKNPLRSREHRFPVKKLDLPTKQAKHCSLAKLIGWYPREGPKTFPSQKSEGQKFSTPYKTPWPVNFFATDMAAKWNENKKGHKYTTKKHFGTHRTTVCNELLFHIQSPAKFRCAIGIHFWHKITVKKNMNSKMDREMDGEVKLEIFVWSTCGGIPTKKYWAPLQIAWFTVFEIMPDKTRRQCGPKGNHETNIKCLFQRQVTHTEVSFQKISMVNDWRDVGDDNLVMVTMVMWWWYWWWKWLWSKNITYIFLHKTRHLHTNRFAQKFDLHNGFYTQHCHNTLYCHARKIFLTHKFLQTKISTHKSCWTHLFKRYLLYTSAFLHTGVFYTHKF